MPKAKKPRQKPKQGDMDSAIVHRETLDNEAKIFEKLGKRFGHESYVVEIGPKAKS